MSYANITIEINGVEIGATVEYDYTPKVPAKLYGHPDDQHEGELEHWELYGLAVDGYEHDFFCLMDIDLVAESIIESIKESWDD